MYITLISMYNSHLANEHKNILIQYTKQFLITQVHCFIPKVYRRALTGKLYTTVYRLKQSLP